MSVEAARGAGSQDRLSVPAGDLVRVQVVFHAWRMDTGSVRGARHSAGGGRAGAEGASAGGAGSAAGRRLGRSRPDSAGEVHETGDGGPAGVELTGPGMVVLVIGVVAAVDSTGIALGLTLVVAGLLLACWMALARRVRQRGGRHRARGRGGYSIIAARRCAPEGRP